MRKQFLTLVFISVLGLLLQRTNSYQCGTFAPKMDKQEYIKISNSVAVQFDAKWPWMVALFSRELGICGGGDNQFCCTASIIGPHYVLTAAHCFMAYKGQQRRDLHNNIFLRLGSHNHSSENAIEPQLEKVVVHSEYNEDTFVNDLAIIKLIEPLTFTANVKPICLAHSASENVSPKKAYIVGWGRHHEAEYDDGGNELGRAPDVQPEMLREGHAQMRNADECAKLLFDNLGICLGERICLEIGYQNSEPGDSGGPLLTLEQNGSAWTQIGVSSIATLKNENRVAILYTRVSDYCGWIEQNTDGEVKCL